MYVTAHFQLFSPKNVLEDETNLYNYTCGKVVYALEIATLKRSLSRLKLLDVR